MALSCLDRLGVDLLVFTGVGGGVRVWNTGSDSPSNVAALARCRKDELPGPKLRGGRLIGRSEVRGIREEDVEKRFPTLG